MDVTKRSAARGPLWIPIYNLTGERDWASMALSKRMVESLSLDTLLCHPFDFGVPANDPQLSTGRILEAHHLEVARRVEAFKIDISIYSEAPNLYRRSLWIQGIANGDLHEHIHAAIKPHPRRLYC